MTRPRLAGPDLQPPAPRPCPFCPYRLDAPSGVWARSEYEKLPPYDGETFEQPPQMFLCHRHDGRVCAGWCGTHDMDQALSVRLAAFQGVPAEVIEAIATYETDVPLHPSGAAAAAHGLADLDGPGDKADHARRQLLRQHPEMTLEDPS